MSTTIRTEEDIIGNRNISSNVYYGIHTLRAKENFHISNTCISDIPELVHSIVMVKKAVALTNKELNVIPNYIANVILIACDEILIKCKFMDQFPIDLFQGGAGTSVNMNVNEVLANIGLELMGYKKGEYQFLNPNDHLNLCQSTNDVYPTGLRLSIYKIIQKLIKSISYLRRGLKLKSKQFSDIIKIGRTQLQDAVPMTLGQEFYAFSILLKEEINNLSKISKILLEINLGATAIGTKLNTPKEYQSLAIKKLTEISGLKCVASEDLIEATSDCSSYVLIHSILKCLAVKLSKICNDLRLLSSGPRSGFNEINLPQLQAGSSMMPSKINPVLPEVVNQVCFKIIGNDVCITMAAESGQLQLNAMEPIICQSMFESINILTNACYSLQNKCIKGITANKNICEKYVKNSIGLITYLNPFIGHKNGDMIGKICDETGKNVIDVILEKNLLTKNQLNEIFSKENLINPQYKFKKCLD
ncbi:MAG: aspartate ammonia-lyase [Enterobacterales bacterium]